MLDCSPPILALLVAAATALIALGLLGRRDRARPTCRACGKDARVAVEGTVARCACGADLYARRAVRWQRRRRWKLSVAGIILALATAAFGWLALHVRSNGPSWCVILPAPLYEMALRHQWEGPAAHSLKVVLAETPDKATRERYADAVVESWEGARWPLPEEGIRALGVALRHGLSQEGVEALVELVARSFTMDALPTAPDGPLALRVARTYSTSFIPLLVRIDRVRLGDRELAWSVNDGSSADAALVWRQPWTQGIEVRLPNDIDLSSESVRRDLCVDATVALAHNALTGVHRDPSIVNVSDTAAWNVDVVSKPFTMRGLTASAPGSTAPRSRSALERVANERWKGLIGPPDAPSVAAIPVLEAAGLGLGLGLAVGVAAVVAGRMRAPRCRLGAPHCISCGSTLAPGLPLPPRCTECGRPVSRIDDAAWTRRGSRPRLVVAWAVGLALVVFAAYALERWAAAPLRQFLTAAVATPEREVRWLVRETIAMRPVGIRPSPSDRFSGGALDFQQKRFRVSRELLRVAADEIVRWAAEGGELPPSTWDETGVLRRGTLESILVHAMAQRDEHGAPVLSEDAVAKVLLHLYGSGAVATTPTVVRQGAPIEAAPTIWGGGGVWAAFSRGCQCEPRKFDAIGLATVRVRTSVRCAVMDTPFLDLVSNHDVLVVPGDAVHVPPELVSVDLARRLPLDLTLCECGARDDVHVGLFPSVGVLWVGRWDVLGFSGATLGSFESKVGGPAFGLVALPASWPETLTLRFTPALRNADEGPLPKREDGAYWSRVVRFTFTADGDDRARQSRIRRYRLTDATLE